MGAGLLKEHNGIEVSHEAQITIAQLQFNACFQTQCEGDISKPHIM